MTINIRLVRQEQKMRLEFVYGRSLGARRTFLDECEIGEKKLK